MKLNRNSKIFINYFLGPVLFLWLAGSIYRQIMHQPDLGKAWQHINDSINSIQLWNLVIVLVLMICNWSIEAIKWKISVKWIQPVSFLKAFRAIFSGVAFSVSTPNRVGEYVGRVLYMKEGNRLRTISLTIVGSMSQLIITLLMGCIGLAILFSRIVANNLLSPVWLLVIVYGSLGALFILTLIYFRLKWLTKWISRIPQVAKYAYLIKVLDNFNATMLFKLLSLSALRFLVFTLQYYLLFRLFNVQLMWWQAFWAVSVLFLVLAVIPTFAIAELGLRGEVGLTVVGLFSTNGLGIWITTIAIWFINLIIPAIIGSLLIFSIKKIFSNKYERP